MKLKQAYTLPYAVASKLNFAQSAAICLLLFNSVHFRWINV